MHNQYKCGMNRRLWFVSHNCNLHISPAQILYSQFLAVPLRHFLVLLLLFPFTHFRLHFSPNHGVYAFLRFYIERTKLVYLCVFCWRFFSLHFSFAILLLLRFAFDENAFIFSFFGVFLCILPYLPAAINIFSSILSCNLLWHSFWSLKHGKAC